MTHLISGRVRRPHPGGLDRRTRSRHGSLRQAFHPAHEADHDLPANEEPEGGVKRHPEL